MDIYALLDKYRDGAQNNREQGDKFERLIKSYLLTDSLYTGDNAFTDVWLWGEFPYREQLGGQDTGIDIVARTAAGAWWAVQCKFYKSGVAVSKEDVDSFLATSSHEFVAKTTDGGTERVHFDERYIIYTGRETWGRNAEEAIQNQKPPVNRITLNDLATSNVDWDKLDAGLFGEAARLPQYTPKDYQREAIDAAARYFEKYERGKLIMACGTGKTFTSLRIAERITGERGLVLFLVPSLALVNQTLREWYSQAIKPFTGICVCSDPKVSKQEEEDDAGVKKLTELALPATTDAHTLAKRLAADSDDDRRRLTPQVTVDGDGDRKTQFTVVFSTYQSIDVVAEAQRLFSASCNDEAAGVFDLIIADEAHRTTGVTLLGKGDGDFVRVHDDGFIKSRHRMYMTATPRIYSDSSKTKAQIAQAALFSMDNEALYGEEIYKIGFSEAVKRELLAPYKVVIFTVSEGNIPPAILEKIASQKGTIGQVNRQLTMDEAARLIGSVCALSKQVIGDNEIIAKDDPAKMKRAVAFLPRINDSKYIAKQFPIVANDYVNALKDETKRQSMVHLAAEHIDGTMDALEKGRRIEWLRMADDKGIADNIQAAADSDDDGDSDSMKAAQAGRSTCRVLCNVRCLSEGVDVPSLDAVIFLSTKSSQLEVIQAVGRVMRRAAGKKYGYIIIPVYVPQKQDAIDALDQTKEYEIVWAVLNALKSHDEAFSQIVDKIALLNMKVNNGIISVVAPEVRFGKKPPRGGGGGDGGGDDPGGEEVDLALDYELRDVQDYIFSRIVDKVSDKFFLQAWAHEVAEIAQAHIARINAMLDYDESGEMYAEFDKTSAESAAYQKRADELRAKFDEFMAGLRQNINDSITRQQAVEMLSQHIITAPIFDALFGNTDFTRYNPISRSMEEMLFVIRQNGLDRVDETTAAKLKGFYDNIKDHISHLDNAEAKQKVIVKLYDNFFKIAFPKMAKTMGIVYTPVEVVDFILHSVEAVLRREFSRGITDEGVNVIDPFTGTGTFIVRLLQSGIIGAQDMERKYTSELFANEIVLLAYYIAAANIESAYASYSDGGRLTPPVTMPVVAKQEKRVDSDSDGKTAGGRFDTPIAAQSALNDHVASYKQFAGICLTDTFELFERGTSEQLPYDFLRENSERVERQKKSPITVIVGNPPYSIGQTSANDNAQNLHYPKLEGEIAGTYVAQSNAALNKGLYDTYVKAFKWATLRLGDEGGVIGFITNSGWLDSNGMDGMRRCFAQDFSDIYVLNLRGAIRGKMGESARQEGENIFDIMTGVAITILVKKEHKEGCNIHYYAMKDYMTREEKKAFLMKAQSIESSLIEWQSITPNDKGDWINQRSGVFDTLEPLAPEKKEDEAVRAVFTTYATGIATGRDFWVYSFRKSKTADNMKRMIAEYERQRNAKVLTMDSAKISWTRALKRDFANNTEHHFNSGAFRTVMYRPFCKEHLYYDKPFIESPGIWSRLFPTSATPNLVIYVPNTRSDKPFSTMIFDTLADYGPDQGGCQCFPLHYYTEERAAPAGEFAFDAKYSAQIGELALTKRVKHDGVSDWILHKAREKYSDGDSDGDGKRGSVITKEDIFYYVYGFLHSPDYREKFKADLKKSLPRIPLVDRAEDFWAFSRAGRELAQLHLHYEDYAEAGAKRVRVTGAECTDFTVQKMKWADKDKKDTLIYNSKIHVEGIPPDVREYVVNGRSALGWVMERYQVKTDKDSGITNDPNDWAREAGKPRYILDLVLSVIEVSVRTVGIVRGLPRVGERGEE